LRLPRLTQDHPPLLLAWLSPLPLLHLPAPLPQLPPERLLLLPLWP
jgi:hypothetical protein